jgi:hypothetical protein
MISYPDRWPALLEEAEHRLIMKSQRQWERENRARLDAEWDALPDGRPWNIEDHIAGRKL